jgi:hypothetical protein
LCTLKFTTLNHCLENFHHKFCVNERKSSQMLSQKKDRKPLSIYEICLQTTDVSMILKSIKKSFKPEAKYKRTFQGILMAEALLLGNKIGLMIYEVIFGCFEKKQ